MKFPRAAGILLHPTSLPGPYGVGSFDRQAYAWIDFLADAGQSLWQVLPLGPTSEGDSPYQSFSSHAGNPNLIGLEPLAEMGLLELAWLADAPRFSADQVDYGQLYDWKRPLLHRVAAAFDQRADDQLKAEFSGFCEANEGWLEDYALFMAIKESQDNRPWYDWPDPLRSRKKGSLGAFSKGHREQLHEYRVIQWLFFRQWNALRGYANERNVRIFGDLPIFVAMDSADAWVEPRLFWFDEDLRPEFVAGVPPDYFSATGQLWGNPLYRWEQMRRRGYKWWLRRLESVLKLYDIVRIDHFRGFADYWEIPAGEETAVEGRWMPGPGSHFFKKVRKRFGDLPVVAEDLGQITSEVLELRDEFELPGMLVLQFAFGSGPDNPFLPHRHRENFIVYTGTHDNDTSLGWYRNSSSQAERDFFHRYTGCRPQDVVDAMIRAAMTSVAHTAVIPMQDWLHLDSQARMNTPSKPFGNWQWRLTEDRLTDELRDKIRDLALVSERLPAE